MFDYYSSIRIADNISNKANILREQAKNVSAIKDIVGKKYSGKDAKAYRQAVAKSENELNVIASKLDELSKHIRLAAKEINDEESTLE